MCDNLSSHAGSDLTEETSPGVREMSVWGMDKQDQLLPGREDGRTQGLQEAQPQAHSSLLRPSFLAQATARQCPASAE